MDKITQFRITEIRLAGFKSFNTPVEFSFGDPTVITGGNGRGKSSIADAIAFAITGQPFFGERKIDKLHNETQPNDLYVAIHFVDDRDNTHELCRTRKGSRMTISYDGIELRQLDLTEMFGERDVFLSIFNPLYFIEELGDDGKNLLQRYLPQIPNEAILAELSPAMQEQLKDSALLSPEGQIKRLREEVKQLESANIYLQGQKDLVETQSKNGAQAMQELQMRITALEEEQTALEEKRYQGIDVAQLQSQLADLSAQYSELSSDGIDHSTTADKRILELNRKIAARKAAVYEPKYAVAAAEQKEKVNGLLAQYKKEQQVFSGIAKDRCCPTCHRKVTEEDIPAMKTLMTQTLDTIVKAGTEERAKLEELKELEQKAHDTFEQFKAEDIAKLEQELNEAEKAREAELARQSGYNPLSDIRAEIQSITSDLEYGHLDSTEYDRLKACGKEIEQAQAELSALQKTLAIPVEDFTEAIEAGNAEIKAKKDMIQCLTFFISKRAELLFSQLKMNRVAISLYDVVKSSGEVKDAFKFTYNGRRYDRLSLSEKIRAGMEVSELIKRLTGRNYPVFVDNMESVDDLANVNPTGQIFMAKCVANTPLSVRAIKPILTPMEQAA